MKLSLLAVLTDLKYLKSGSIEYQDLQSEISSK